MCVIIHRSHCIHTEHPVYIHVNIHRSPCIYTDHPVPPTVAPLYSSIRNAPNSTQGQINDQHTVRAISGIIQYFK